MPDWSQPGGILDFCAVYFTTQLARCALFSIVLTGAVMILRKTLFSERTFLRGMLWALFLVIPFLGKLKLFYEDTAIGKATWRLTYGTMTCLWADRIYMAGILVAALCIFGKRFRLQRKVASMEKVIFEKSQVCITDMNITPFTAGLLKPKIILPKVIADNYSMDELKAVVQHEQTHIRLGHLWWGLLWDILRCLFWINPFLTIFQKQFRADMEDVCDRVCIQNSGRTAHEYGMLLVKTLKLLRCGLDEMPPAAAFAGEKDFGEMKRRIGKIAGFCPYRKKLCTGLAVVLAAAMGMVLLMIHNSSYARFSTIEDILVYEFSDGGASLLDYDNSLYQMISYDDSYVYVNREEFDDFLHRNHAEGEIYIVFGGYYKMPGLGGAAESCFYESNSRDKVLQIPYENTSSHWGYWLFKLL